MRQFEEEDDDDHDEMKETAEGTSSFGMRLRN